MHLTAHSLGDTKFSDFRYYVPIHLLESEERSVSIEVKMALLDYLEDFFYSLELADNFVVGAISPAFYATVRQPYKERKKESRKALLKTFTLHHIDDNFKPWITKILTFVATRDRIKELKTTCAAFDFSQANAPAYHQLRTQYDTLQANIKTLESGIQVK
jgi:hypothetical protein